MYKHPEAQKSGLMPEFLKIKNNLIKRGYNKYK